MGGRHIVICPLGLDRIIADRHLCLVRAILNGYAPLKFSDGKVITVKSNATRAAQPFSEHAHEATVEVVVDEPAIAPVADQQAQLRPTAIEGETMTVTQLAKTSLRAAEGFHIAPSVVKVVDD